MQMRHSSIVLALLGTCACPGAALAQSGAAPSLEDAANAVITGVYDRPVRLEDGLFEGQPFVEGGEQRPRIEMARTLSLAGDFDDDGRADRAVFLTENSGGTGRFVYLALITATDAGPENTLTVAIGDREHPYDLTFEDGALNVHMIGHGPSDPGCCATRDMTVRIVASDGELISRETTLRDPARPAMLDGTQWRLARFDWDSAPLGPDIDITLDIADGRVTGLAACNRYFADIADSGDPAPLAFSLEAIGVTRMACPPAQMSAEDAYLDRLTGLHSFGFDFGQLVLLYSHEDGAGAMIFLPAE